MNEITKAQFDSITASASLAEICEFHSHGAVFEAIEYFDNGDPCVIVSETVFANRFDYHNISCVGSGEAWSTAVSVRYYRHQSVNAAVAHMVTLLQDDMKSFTAPNSDAVTV